MNNMGGGGRLPNYEHINRSEHFKEKDRAQQFHNDIILNNFPLSQGGEAWKFWLNVYILKWGKGGVQSDYEGEGMCTWPLLLVSPSCKILHEDRDLP